MKNPKSKKNSKQVSQDAINKTQKLTQETLDKILACTKDLKTCKHEELEALFFTLAGLQKDKENNLGVQVKEKFEGIKNTITFDKKELQDIPEIIKILGCLKASLDLYEEGSNLVNKKDGLLGDHASKSDVGSVVQYSESLEKTISNIISRNVQLKELPEINFYPHALYTGSKKDICNLISNEINKSIKHAKEDFLSIDLQLTVALNNSRDVLISIAKNAEEKTQELQKTKDNLENMTKEVE